MDIYKINCHSQMEKVWRDGDVGEWAKLSDHQAKVKELQADKEMLDWLGSITSIQLYVKADGCVQIRKKDAPPNGNGLTWNEPCFGPDIRQAISKAMNKDWLIDESIKAWNTRTTSANREAELVELLREVAKDIRDKFRLTNGMSDEQIINKITKALQTDTEVGG